MSQILGNSTNVKYYSAIYDQLTKEFHTAFYNPSVKGYDDGGQAANTLALSAHGVVPADLRATVLNSLVTNVETVGHFTGGIVSVANFFPLLSSSGHHDLAMKIATATSLPSYGYMFNNPIQNATTTWEEWETLPAGSDSSLNHHMFNSIGSWFYRYVAGIELNALNVIEIHPRMIQQQPQILDKVEAEVITIKGRVVVEWQRVAADVVDLLVVIPPNAQAKVSFEPLMKDSSCVMLLNDGQLLWKRGSSLEGLSEDSQTGTMSLSVGSGEYHFTAIWQ